MGARPKAILSLGLLLSIQFAAPVCAAPPAIPFAGGVLSIKINRYEVRWQRGSMIGARSLLPKATELTICGLYSPGATPVHVEGGANGATVPVCSQIAQ